MPVAMRRFSLKYVFNANELAEEFIPEPAPVRVIFRKALSKLVIIQGRNTCKENLPYKMENVIKYVVNELEIDVV